MKRRIPIIFSWLMLVALVLSQAVQVARAGNNPGPDMVVRYASRSDATGPLIDIPPKEVSFPDWYVVPRKWLPNRPTDNPIPGDGAVQEGEVPVGSAAVQANFEGVNNVNGVLPPDTNGDVGPNHYVQMVNLSFAIWDKAGNKLYGPASTNTLWSGFGGACQNSNDGDPIVLYDHLADRWLMSQFALPSYPRGPFYQCIAISQTPDPTGAWYRYEFTVSATKMNDYPHFGVWPDGYYMSMNQFNQGRLTWGGQGVVVFERSKMLLGQTARMVYFDLYNTDSNLGGMLPSDLDGPVPPAGAPNTYAEIDDDAWGYSPDQLQLWSFHVDWNNTANSTFTKTGTVPVAAFDSDLCGGARNCIPQPGGTAVDALADRLMYRLQYRNFGSRQTLVVNHTVDTNGADHAGVRWYELRNTGGGWSLYQQGTFSPDANHRWVGSVALNGQGDLALGYSISSATVYPSIRVTGRFDGDALGTMTQGETTIVNGTGFQGHSAGRWGDYASMSVDPSDDCTFWFTTEYFTSQVSGNAAWQTRIGSFKLRDCGGTPVDNPPSVTITSPAAGATVSGTVAVNANASDDKGVTQVEFFADGASLGVDSTAPYSVNWNTTTAADGSHTLTATATDTIGQTASSQVAVTVSNAVSQTMHVGDLDGSGAASKAKWNATVTITVHDAAHNPVSGVTVSGAWSAGASGSASCTTNSSGVCSVTKTNLTARTTSVTFTVNGLTKAGFTYQSSANHDVDGGTNGTTITVNRP